MFHLPKCNQKDFKQQTVLGPRFKAKSFDPALLTITRGQSHKLYLELHPYCAAFFLCEHGLSATGPAHYMKGAPSIAPALCPTHIDAKKRGLLMMLMSLHSMPLLLVQKQCTQGRAKKRQETCRNILLPWACSIYILQLTELAQEIFGLSPCQHMAEIMYASVALQSTSTKYLTGNMKTLNIWSVDYLLSSNVIHILAVDLCIEMLDGLAADWLKQPFLPLYSSALCIALAFGLCGHPQLLQFINDMNIYPTIYFINYIKCQLLRWRHLGVIPPSATFAEIHWKRWPDSEHPSLARTAFPLPFIALPAMGVHRSQ